MDAGELTGGVDLHAHWMGADVFGATEVAGGWPRLEVDSAERGRILIGDRPFRDVRPSLWDIDARLMDLDAAGLELQVISPVPVTFPYVDDAGAATAYAEATNASIARAVAASRGRLAGLGTVPLPHADGAVAVLEALMAGPEPLVGVEIGARVGRLELDDPQLRPFFEAAEALGALVFVHPSDGGTGTVRRSGQPYDFGLGMHTDTALAAGALVFGGVLERYPGLRVVLAHGCGGFAWSYPRLRLGAELLQGHSPGAIDERVRSLYVDSLVLDAEHLRLLVHRFGADRIVLGTDHPFFPDLTGGARDMLAGAEVDRVLGAGVAQRVFRANGLDLLRRSAVPA